MNQRKGTRVMAAVLGITALFAFLFGGCRKSPPAEEPIDGGNTVHIDENAPKAVASSDLTEFSATLYIATRYSGDENHDFSFSVAPDETGSPVASEEYSGVSLPADQALLDGLADVISRYDLASMNGVYDVTAGLPPDFDAHPFRAAYASGEEINFTVNNEPYAAWEEAVYDVFAAWFDSRGIDALWPEPETSQLVHFTLDIVDGSRSTRYGGINVGEENAVDGQTYLLERDAEGGGILGSDSRKFILFPGDFYEKLTAVIAETDLFRNYEFSYYDRAAGNYGNHDEGYFGWGGKTTADEEPDDEKLCLSLHLEYESGYRINIDTRKRSEIEAMQPLVDALTAYLDPLFR